MSGRSRQLVDALNADLAQLITESKRKSPEVKLAAERSLLRLRGVTTSGKDDYAVGIAATPDILQTFLRGCEETKNPRIVQLSVSNIHRLISNGAILPTTVNTILDALWKLMDASLEELKVLQCVLALVSSAVNVHGPALSKAVSLCFRLHFSKDPTNSAIAAATLRQVVTITFERVIAEDSTARGSSVDPRASPEEPAPGAGDAFLLFQDLCLLTNGEAPHWLQGVNEMTRTFGLELIETALTSCPALFFNHPELGFLLKERVCSLIIKLFSPSLKHAGKAPGLVFPVTIRLLRIMDVLIRLFSDLLATESEIFLSMLVKFLEADKAVMWQRVAALEVIHNITKQPRLLVLFCRAYDMQPHSTKVFRDLINGVGGFVKSQHQADGEAIGPPATGKPMFLEMLDKPEASAVPETYPVSLALAALADTIKSMSSLLPAGSPGASRLDRSGAGTALPRPGTPDSAAAEEAEAAAAEGDAAVLAVMVESAWTGLLTALALLLRRKTTSAATECILRRFQSFIRLTGTLGMRTARDAFLNTLCAMCVPDHYTFSAEPPREGWRINDKNLQCVHILFNSALCLGALLDTAWPLVINTIHLLVGILDFPNSATGGTQAHFTPQPAGSGASSTGRRPGHRRSSSGSNLNPGGVAVTAAAASELPALGAMLAQLFEMSRNLSDESLMHLVPALCAQSEMTLQQMAVSQSVTASIYRHNAHLFPVSKLFAVGQANLHRIMVFWPAVTAHLIEVSAQQNSALRDKAVDSLTRLVHLALAFPRTPPIQESPGLQQAILSPLRNLVSCSSPDVHRRQLECVKQVLDSSGDSLAHAWPVVIGIVHDSVLSTVSDQVVVRVAFECMNMIVTDFLPTVPTRCYILLLEALGGFAKQQVAVNISLRAVGSLWSMSDYLSKNEARLADEFSAFASSGTPDPQDGYGLPTTLTTRDLWLSLLAQLAEATVDLRPEVRKGACQTLFSTINTHARLFVEDTWRSLLKEVLLPLLDKVKAEAIASVDQKVDVPKDVMVHHSRNTAEKQWDETRVLVVSGISDTVAKFFASLSALGEFQAVWEKVFGLVEEWTSSSSDEVARAAATALSTLLRATTEGGVGAAADAAWSWAWQSWLRIAAAAVSRDPPHADRILAAIVAAFPLLFKHIHRRFEAPDARKLLTACRRLVCVQHKDALMSTQMTDTQAAAMDVLAILTPSEEYPQASLDLMPLVLDEHVTYFAFACDPPWTHKNRCSFVNVSLSALDGFTKYFGRYCEEPSVIRSQVALRALQSFRTPLAQKYSGPSRQLWRRVMSGFVEVVDHALRGLASMGAAAPPDICKALWAEIVSLVEVALFSDSPLPPDGLSTEDAAADEALDVAIVGLARDTMLPGLAARSRRGSSRAGTDAAVPKWVLSKVFELLQRGSIGTLASPVSAVAQPGQPPAGMVREQFARACFEALVDASAEVGGDAGGTAEDGLLPMGSLLSQCTDALQSYIDECARHPPAPERVAETVLVMRAVESLVSPKLPRAALALYPLLVALISCAPPEMLPLVQQALSRYTPLLATAAGLDSTV